MPARTVPMRRSGPIARAASAVKPRRQRDTGATDTVLARVHRRSKDRCEWPACPNARVQTHHRLNRKAGGRHGEVKVRINQAAWLLDACVDHHGYVTSPWGAARVEALASGWLLLEGQDALLVPVLTRHAPGLVLLTNAGRWTEVDAT